MIRLVAHGLAFTLLLATASTARAELSIVDSVEWLTCRSDVAAVGQLISVTRSKKPGGRRSTVCVLQVSEMIKGEGHPRLTFACPSLSENEETVLKSRADLLVFLSSSKLEGKPDPAVAPTPPELLLTDAHHWPDTVIDLSQPLRHLYSKALRKVTDRADLLAICRGMAPVPISNSLQRDVHPGLPFHGELYGGSAVYLVVPADEEYRAEYLKLAHSKSSSDRQDAAANLWKYPGPETERVLRGLLEDTAEMDESGTADDDSEFAYFVRAAALESLKQLGKPVPDIVLKRQLTKDEQRKIRHDYWRNSFQGAFPDGWLIAVQDAQSRPGASGDQVAVWVNLAKGPIRCRWVVMSRDWKKSPLPQWGPIEMYTARANSGRLMGLQGSMPQKEKELVIACFELVPVK